MGQHAIQSDPTPEQLKALLQRNTSLSESEIAGVVSRYEPDRGRRVKWNDLERRIAQRALARCRRKR